MGLRGHIGKIFAALGAFTLSLCLVHSALGQTAQSLANPATSGTFNLSSNTTWSPGSVPTNGDNVFIVFTAGANGSGKNVGIFTNAPSNVFVADSLTVTNAVGGNQSGTLTVTFSGSAFFTSGVAQVNFAGGSTAHADDTALTFSSNVTFGAMNFNGSSATAGNNATLTLAGASQGNSLLFNGGGENNFLVISGTLGLTGTLTATNINSGSFGTISGNSTIGNLIINGNASDSSFTIASSTMSITGATASVAGGFTLASGATITLSGGGGLIISNLAPVIDGTLNIGNQTVNGKTNWSNDGTVSLAGGFIVGNNLTNNSDGILVGSGSLSNLVVNLGTILTTNNTLAFASNIVQGGTMTIGGSSTISLLGSGALTNFGIINLVGAAGTGSNAILNLGSVAITNKSGGTITGGGIIQNSSQVVNLSGGTILATSTVVELQFTNANTFGNAGTIGAATGATLTFGTAGVGSAIITNFGTINLTGGTLLSGNITNLATGFLGGNGTVTGAVINSGIVNATNGELQLLGAASGAGTYRAVAGASAATLTFAGGGSISSLFNTNATVQFKSTVTNTAVFANQGTLVLAGGTYQSSANLTNAAGKLIVNSGAGTINAAGVFNLGTILTTNATVTISNLVQGGTVTIGSAGTLGVSGTLGLTNFGTINLAGAAGAGNNAVLNLGSAVLTNLSGGTITGGGIIQNSSQVVNLSGGSILATSTVVELQFTNANTVGNAGTIGASSGATLTFGTAGVGSAIITNYGTINLSNGTLLSGNITNLANGFFGGTGVVTAVVVNQGRMNFSGTISNGLQNSGSFTLNDDTTVTSNIVVNSGGVLDLVGNNLTNSAALVISSGGVLTNGVAGGLVNGGLSNGGTIFVSQNTFFNGPVTNTGAFLWQGAISNNYVQTAGTNTINGAATITQNATVNGGILNLNGKSLSNGLLVISGTGLLTNNTAGATLNGGVTNAATVNFASDVYVNGAVTNTGTWIQRGAISNSVNNSGTMLVLSNNIAARITGTIINSGSLTFTNSYASGLVTNSGSFSFGGAISNNYVQTGGSITLNNTATITGTASVNSGTFDLNGKTYSNGLMIVSGTGILSNGVANATFNGGLSNAGAVAVTANTFFNGAVTNTGAFLWQGAISNNYVQSAGTNTLNGNATITQSATVGGGLFNLNGKTYTNGLMIVSGTGVLTNGVAGATFNGGLSNAGAVAVTANTFFNSPVTNTGAFLWQGAISNNYVQTAGTNTLNGTSTITLNASVNGGIFNLNGQTYSNNLMIVDGGGAGVLTNAVAGATFNGGLSNASTVAVTANTFFNGVVTNTGAFLFQGVISNNLVNSSTGSVTLNNTATITKTATLNGGTFNLNGQTYSNGLMIVSSTGVLTNAVAGATFNGGLSNAATVAFTANTFFNGPITNMAAMFFQGAISNVLVNDGSFDLNNNATLTAAPVNNGTININAMTLTVTPDWANAGSLQINGGVLAGGNVTNNSGEGFLGFGTISNLVVNNGTLTASGGTLTLVLAPVNNGTAIVANASALNVLPAWTNSGLLSNAPTGTVSGGTLTNTGTINGLGFFNNQVVNQNRMNFGGVISNNLLQTAGSFTVNGSGTITGTTTINGGTLDLSGGQLTNGLLVISGTGLLTNNVVGATLNGGVTNAATVNFASDVYVNGAVTNTGTWIQRGAISNSVMNSGTMLVLSNNIAARITGTLVNSGSLTFTNAYASGLVTNSGSFSFGGTISNNYVQTAGSITLNNTATITGTASVNSGTFDLNGKTYSNGLMVVSGTGILTNGVANATFNGGLSNAATVTVTANTFFNGPVTNTGNFSMQGAVSNGFANAGTLTINNNTTITGVLNNGGTLNVNNGTLNMGNDLVDSGLINVGTATTAATLSNANLYLVGSGEINFTNASGSAANTLLVGGTFTNTTQSIIQNTGGGSVLMKFLDPTKIVTNQGTMSFDLSGGSGTLVLQVGSDATPGTLFNSGTIVAALSDGAANRVYTFSNQFVNAGSFLVTNNSTAVGGSLSFVVAGGAVTNLSTGTMQLIASGTGSGVRDVMTLTSGGFVNNGTLVIDQSGGTAGNSDLIVLSGAGTSFSNAVGGQLIIGPGNIGSVQIMSDNPQNLGTNIVDGGTLMYLTKTGGSVNFTNKGVVVLNGGNLAVGPAAGTVIVNSNGLIETTSGNGTLASQVVNLNGATLLATNGTLNLTVTPQQFGLINVAGGAAPGTLNVTPAWTNNGVLNVASGATVNGGNLTNNGSGVVTNFGTVNTLLVNQGRVVLGGTISNNYQQTSGTNTISGSGTITGTATVTGGLFDLNGGAYSNGLMIVGGTGILTDAVAGATFSGGISNADIVAVTADTFFNGPVTNTGAFYFQGAISNSFVNGGAGTVTLNSGATITGNTLVNGGTFNLNGKTLTNGLLVVSGNGVLTNSIAGATVNGGVSNAATIAVTADTFFNGPVTNTGVMFYRGAISNTLVNSGSFNLNNNVTLTAAPINNGTINVASSKLTVIPDWSNGGSLQISGGTLTGGNVTNLANESFSGFGTVSNLVVNQGTLTATGGTLTLVVAPVNNGTAIVANASDLNVLPAWTNGGVLSNAATGAVSGGTLTNTGTINGSGYINPLVVNQGRMNFGGTISNNLVQTAGSFTVSGSATITGTASINGGSFDLNGGTYSNGLMIVNGTGVLTNAIAGATFNGGLSNAATVAVTANTFFTGPVTNTGTFALLGAVSNTLANSGNVILNGSGTISALVNNGSVNVNAGTLSLLAAPVQNGSITVANGATVNAAQAWVNNGTITLLGGSITNAAITNNSFISGYGTIDGAGVVNNGKLFANASSISGVGTETVRIASFTNNVGATLGTASSNAVLNLLTSGNVLINRGTISISGGTILFNGGAGMITNFNVIAGVGNVASFPIVNVGTLASFVAQAPISGLSNLIATVGVTNNGLLGANNFIGGAATLSLTVSGGGAAIVNQGTVALQGGFLTVNGGAGTITNITNGLIFGTGTQSLSVANLTGGTILASNGVFSLGLQSNANAGLLSNANAASTIALTNSTLVNSGTVALNGGGFLLNGTVTNEGTIYGSGAFVSSVYNDTTGLISATGGVMNVATNLGETVSNFGLVTISIGGTLNVVSSWLNTNGTVNLLGGGLTGGALTNAGTITGFGTISSQVVNTSGGTLNVASAGSLTLVDAPVQGGWINIPNTSTLNVLQAWLNSGTVNIQGGNLVGSTITNAGSITGFGTITPLVRNNGGATFTVTGGTMTLSIAPTQNGTFIVTNSGTLNVLAAWQNSGTVNLLGGSIIGSTLTNSATLTGFGGVQSLVNNGNIFVTNGTLQAGTSFTQNNTVDVAANSRLDVTPAWANNGSVSVDGGFISGGTMTNTTTGLLRGFGTISNSVANLGTILATNGTLKLVNTLSQSGTINIASAATFNMSQDWQNNGQVNILGGSLAGGVLTNAGTISGSGTISTALSNTGYLRATNGLLTVQTLAGNQAAGILEASAGATLAANGTTAWLNNGQLTLSGGTVIGGDISNNASHIITGAGTVNVNVFNSGSIVANTAGQALTFNDSLVNLASGVITANTGNLVVNGTFTNAGTLNMVHSVGTFTAPVVNSGAWITDPSTNIFQGNYTVASSGYIQSGSGSVYIFSNNATTASSFINISTNKSQYNTLQSTFVFDNTLGATQQFSVAGHDFGPTAASSTSTVLTTMNPLTLPGYSSNFALGTLDISSFTTVQVTDAFSLLGPGTNDNLEAALYLDNLDMGSNSLLLISANVQLYFVNSNNWTMSNIEFEGNPGLDNSISGIHQIAVIPEPGVLMLWLSGFATIYTARRRWRLSRSRQ